MAIYYLQNHMGGLKMEKLKDFAYIVVVALLSVVAVIVLLFFGEVLTAIAFLTVILWTSWMLLRLGERVLRIPVGGVRLSWTWLKTPVIVFFGAMIVSTLLGGAFLEYKHIRMAVKLAGLRNSFSKESFGEVKRPAVDGEKILDCKGKLDQIIRKRNKMLADNGYKAIGSWWANTTLERFDIFYLYTGRRATRK